MLPRCYRGILGGICTDVNGKFLPVFSGAPGGRPAQAPPWRLGAFPLVAVDDGGGVWQLAAE